MPLIFQDGTQIETPEEFEAKLAVARKAGAIKTDEDAQAARLEHQREMLRAQIAASQDKFHTKNLPSPVSFLANRGNTAGFGIPAAAASALTAPVTALASGYDVGLGEAYQLNRQKIGELLGASPASATAGNIAAFFGRPTGNIRAAAQSGKVTDLFRAGGGPSSPIAGVAEKGFELARGTKLAEMAAAGTAPGSKWIGQMLSAFAGGAGAIAAVNAAQYPFGELSATEVVGKTLDQIKDPINVIGSTVFGGASAAARSPTIDRATRNLMQQGERLIPGFKASPDQYRDNNGFVSFLMDSLGKSALGRKAVAAWSRERFFDPLNNSLDELAKGAGLARGWQSYTRESRNAGAAVRELVATDAAGNPAKGSLLGRAKKATDDAFASGAGQLEVPIDAWRQITSQFGSLRAAEAAKAGGGARARSGEWQGVLTKWEKIVEGAARRGEKLPAQALANFMKELADFRDFGSSSSRDAIGRGLEKFEAGMLYEFGRKILGQTSTVLDDAYRTAADLHEAARGLSSITKVDDMTDAATVLATARTPDFTKVWPTLQKQMTARQIDAFRGSYLGQFLAKVAVERGTAVKPATALNARQMDRLWGGSEPAFQRDVFDMVVGRGVRGALRFRGMLSDSFLRSGIGRAEGSQTAGRQDVLEAVNDALEVGSSFVTGRFREAASGVVGFGLGFAGKLGLINSLLNGSLRTLLIDTAIGRPVVAGRRVPAAFATAGGTPALGAAGASAVNGLTANAGAALQGVTQ